MKNSTTELISQIIQLDDCPFTKYEVHGFFIGLASSSIDKEAKYEKAKKFLDLSSNTHSMIDELMKITCLGLSKNELEIYPTSLKDSQQISNALSEWAYYFLISYTNSASSNNADEQEILDIFDEISQVNDKYKLDDEDSSANSLSDINGFIIKSALYLFHRSSNE